MAASRSSMRRDRPGDPGADGRSRRRLGRHGAGGLTRAMAATAAATHIVAVAEIAAPVASPMRNAYVDFSKMTCSVIAVSAERSGRRVTGFGYTSNGRYAQSGLLRERFIPRLLAAPATALADESGDGLDPTRVRDDPHAEREARRPWRAVGGGRRPGDGGLGPRREDRGRARASVHCRSLRPAGARRIGSPSTPRAATTSPRARWRTCARRSGGSSISATRS